VRRVVAKKTFFLYTVVTVSHLRVLEAYLP
jgi:hypothetical protein